jgi:hypothetical protein
MAFYAVIKNINLKMNRIIDKNSDITLLLCCILQWASLSQDKDHLLLFCQFRIAYVFTLILFT